MIGGGDKIALEKLALTENSGPTLLEALDAVETVQRFPDAAVRVPILDKFKDSGRCVLLGKVESGILRVGDSYTIMPGKVCHYL